MRLVLILSLTMLLLGCGNELELGANGTWEFTAGYSDKKTKTGWLLNKETGELRICKELLDPSPSRDSAFRRDCHLFYPLTYPDPSL